MELRKIPIRRSLHRDNLFLGAERELILMSGLIAGVLIVLSLSLPVIIVGIGFWMFVSHFLRKMAKIDPIMSKVYVRFLKYQPYYKAFSTPYRKL